ncbi:MAG: ATP-binding cassette domain-containing protein [Desulfobacterales bacterium]|nr:ATP-binding cassette domain-containing protein [Desulfobacterales bacterium]
MLFTKDDSAVQSCFSVKFPLVLKWDDAFTITFTSSQSPQLEFKSGFYFLCGDNGSGKTTFLNMLALTAGNIGKKAAGDNGRIAYNAEAYNRPGFNHIQAAKIREGQFCIFPQKAFFLPVSTRDNYTILNGSDLSKEAGFSYQEYPDLLSGGQQQKILMDIILDEKKPVWFLDEPLSNLDAERRHYFWEILEKAYRQKLQTVFFIDHGMGNEIKNDPQFRFVDTLCAVTENRQKNRPPEIGRRHIEIYANDSPQNFFKKKIRELDNAAAVTI